MIDDVYREALRDWLDEGQLYADEGLPDAAEIAELERERPREQPEQ